MNFIPYLEQTHKGNYHFKSWIMIAMNLRLHHVKFENCEGRSRWNDVTAHYHNIHMIF